MSENFDGPWTPAPWLRRKFLQMRAAGFANIGLQNNPCGSDALCSVCGGNADNSTLEFVLLKTLPDSERARAFDDPSRRVEGPLVCWLCARELDAKTYRAYEKLQTTPLWDINDCQSLLWWLPEAELCRRMRAENLDFRFHGDPDERVIVIRRL